VKRGLVFLTLVLAVAGSAIAETQVERIEVTGSHIKRIDSEGVSPVQTVTRKELEKTAYNSVADVLRDMSANSFGSARETSGSNNAGIATVNLRGLGSENTLVLLNGQRLPTDATAGAVDLNLIPMAAVERVEVLKDGASAIYGSDALGGVVNIITRRDFKGTEMTVTETVPQLKGGGKHEVSAVNGVNGEKGNVVTVVQFRKNDVIYSRDRDWTDTGVSAIGSPGGYRNAGDKWHADPNCPASQIQHTPAGDFCAFKYSDYSTELPSLQQLSLLSEGNYELSPRARLKGRINATQRRVEWSYAPAPGTFTIPGSVAGTLGPGGGALPGATAGQDLQVRYRLVELGTRDQRIDTLGLGALLGAAIDVGAGWELEITGSHNHVSTKSEGVSGYALTKTLTDLIQQGKFNPFAAPGQRGSLDSARYSPMEDMMTELSSVEAKASGSVGSIAERPIGLAAGTTLTFQKYNDNFDALSVAGEVYGNAGSSGGGSRSTQALFTEVSLPVSEKLELQLAGRYDRYSDFGDTVNPKAAFLYHASPSWLVRGSVGTGFRAPLMQELYAATSDGYPTFIDAVSCEREKQAGGATPSCQPQQYHVVSGGNTNLQAEKATSYNLGAMYEPNADFSVGTDLFMTIARNVVGMEFDEAMKAEAQGISLSDYGVIVRRDGNGYIDSIEAPLQNLSSRQMAGLDLTASYRVHRVKLALEHSQLFYFKQEGFPGMGLRDRLGEAGRPAWRNTLSIGYQISDRDETSLDAMTTAEQEKSVAGAGKLPRYTSFDARYAHKFGPLGTLAVGVKNLLGTTPPLDDSSPNSQLNASIYDQIGRQFHASYKVSF